jgi:hypothetical protein
MMKARHRLSPLKALSRAYLIAPTYQAGWIFLSDSCGNACRKNMQIGCQIMLERNAGGQLA